MFSSLAGAATGAGLVLIATIYALYLREHHPDRYHGVWRYFGTFVSTSGKAARLWAGLVVGWLLGAIAIYEWRLVPAHPTLALMNLLLLAIFFLATALAWMIYQLRRRNSL